MAEPQTTEAADRHGYRSLPQHHVVLFRIYALYQTYKRRQAGELSMSVEYRGTDAELIAAGVVTTEFLVPCPGRPRRDAAGRRVKLERRLEGIRVVTVYGDPFTEPRLPAVSQELVNEAIEERRHNNDREDRQREHVFETPLPEPRERLAERAIVRPPSLLMARCPPELLAARLQAVTGLAHLATLADNFPAQVTGEIWRRVTSLEELMRRELERLAPAEPRGGPSFLKLVVNNTPAVSP
jgi:hypothetical protein